MSNKTILFADDSATMRAIMEKTFAAEPFDVIVVPTGEDALSKARAVNPDVVILDIGMPGLSGYDVCQRLRAESTFSSLPVLLVGGVSTPYDEARAEAAGANEFVKKPFDTTQLIDKVVELSASVVRAAAQPEPVVAAPQPPSVQKPVPLSVPAARPAPPPPPASVRPPMPVPPTPAASKVSKDTIEFGRPSASPAMAKPVPMEAPVVAARASAPSPEPESPIQVGTLAELAQMDERGVQRQPVSHPDAIPLTTVHSKEPSSPVAAALAQQAERIAAEVPGLSADQVEAVRRLTEDVVERIVWEIVPELAETMIKEELNRLLEE